MSLHTIRFRPTDVETLKLLVEVNDKEGADPVAVYSRLMSAACVAAALIALKPDEVSEQAKTFVENATKAVAGRPDIFGKPATTN